MRIYNRKRFSAGVLYFILGITLLTLGFLKGFDTKSIILGVLMPLIGIGEVYVSTNRIAAKQARLEETDERNRQVSFTSTHQAFHIAQNIIFVLMLFFLILGAKQEVPLFMGVGLGFAFSFSIMMFSDIFSSLYYEKHM